jgi:hypothetical protein
VASQIETRGPWQTPYRAQDVLCADGERRTAYFTAEADTYFSIPARVSVKGKTVTGFVMSRTFEDDNGEWRDMLYFVAYSYRKNGYLLPERENESYPPKLSDYQGKDDN